MTEMRNLTRNYADTMFRVRGLRRDKTRRHKTVAPYEVLEMVSAYKLRWERLHEFLVARFPGMSEFKNAEDIGVNDDWYILFLPTSLTQTDMSIINRLRTEKQFDRTPSPAEASTEVFGRLDLPSNESAMILPALFVASYSQRYLYPLNLVCSDSDPWILEERRRRLQDTASDLFVPDSADILVRFHDLLPDGSDFEMRNAFNDDMLKVCLGNEHALDTQTVAAPGSTMMKKDPKCRFIFLSAEHSWSPLPLTIGMFMRIMTYHQVTSAYLDFVSVFGYQEKSRNLRFSGFREQTLLSNPPRGLEILDLDRSGRLFQLCYNLKAPEFQQNQRPRWFIRQAAIHHQFDVVLGNSLWIVAEGADFLRLRLTRLTFQRYSAESRTFNRQTFDTPLACFKSSVAVHLLLCSWSIENWSRYLQFHEDLVDRITQLAVSGPRSRGNRVEYKSAHVQVIQNYEDKINECIMVIGTNIDVVSALVKYYEALPKRIDFPVGTDGCGVVAEFARQANDMIHDLKMQAVRAQLLVRIIGDRKAMMLQHLQAQATEIMEELTNSMFDLAIMTQKDAIAVRIITVVTLIYLPATFVSTFFSTDVIKYQPQDNGPVPNATDAQSGPTYSSLALERWFEVTVPLTLITIAAAVFFYRKYERHAELRAGLIDSLPFYYKPIYHRSSPQDT